MLNLPLEPGQGAGAVRLGTSRHEVRETLTHLGYPVSAIKGEIDFFCDNALQVEHDDGTASFIGIASHRDILCTYCGVDVFDLPAERLFRLIASDERVPPEFDPQEFCFSDQIVTVWEADEQYDYKGGHARRVYGQVGIGDARYLRATS